MSPEVDLVYTLLDSRRQGATGRMLDLLHGAIDTDYLLRYTISHRLLPLVHHRLVEEFRDDIPTAVATSLQAVALQTTQFNLLATSELLRIVRIFAVHGIDLLPWKGPVLALRLYGNVALRPFGDLDILVRPADVLRAGRLLQTIGYAPLVEVKPHQERSFVRYEHDRAYLQQGGGLHLELHWRFFDRYIAFNLDESAIWNGVRTLELGGDSMRLLGAEEELLILALHGAKHVWRSSGWLFDIHRLIECEEIDWQRLEQLAERTGTVRVLSLALSLSGELFGTDPPDTVRRRISDDRMVRLLAGEVRSGPLYRTRDDYAVEDDPRFYLRSRERRRDRLYYLWFWLFTPNIKDQDFLRLPEWLSPLHYLIRPLRLLGGWFRHKRVE